MLGLGEIDRRIKKIVRNKEKKTGTKIILGGQYVINEVGRLLFRIMKG